MTAGSIRGSALLPVLLLMFLFSAIALGAAVVMRVEVTLAHRFRQSAEALSAAEAGLAVAVAELRTIDGWSPVLDGGRVSASSQGAVSGAKRIPGGGTLVVCCGSGSAASRLDAETRASPLPSRRSVQWRPFLWSTLDALTGNAPPSGLFVIVWVGDDEEDGDGEWGKDANGTVIVRAEAARADGLHRALEALVTRVVPGSVAIVSWREVR